MPGGSPYAAKSAPPKKGNYLDFSTSLPRCIPSGYKVLTAAAALLTAGFAAPAAHAQVTHYATLAAWQADSAQTALFDFEGIAPSNGTASNPNLSPLAFSVSGGTSTFATEFGPQATSSSVVVNYTATILNGAAVVGTYSTSSPVHTDFIGFTSVGSSFDRIQAQITQSNPVYANAFDNVRLGNAVTSSAAAPEPGSLALLTPGFLALSGGIVARRKKRVA